VTEFFISLNCFWNVSGEAAGEMHGTKEAEMKIVGCDLHARQQTIAMVDTASGEFTEKTLEHKGEAVRAFYSAL
jgi:hypothetical protein